MDRTEIVLIGTLHEAHRKNANFSVYDLHKILRRIEPEVLFLDLPVSLAGRRGTIPRRIINEGDLPELEAIREIVSRESLDVIPFDIPDLIDRIERINSRRDEAGELLNKWQSELERNDANAMYLQMLSLALELREIQNFHYVNVDPFIINSTGFDRIVRLRHNIWSELLPEILRKFARFEKLRNYWMNYYEFWYYRNSKMVENIHHTLEHFQGKRCAILVGAEHRYVLKDMFPRSDNYIVKEFYDLEL